jgi:hypothetical protein
MWRNPKSRTQEGYYCMCKRKEKSLTWKQMRTQWNQLHPYDCIPWIRNRGTWFYWLIYSFFTQIYSLHRGPFYSHEQQEHIWSKEKFQEHLRFTNQSLCEDILTRRMPTLGYLRMKCWKEYVDQGGTMTGWISIHTRSVCRDSEQFR